MSTHNRAFFRTGSTTLFGLRIKKHAYTNSVSTAVSSRLVKSLPVQNTDNESRFGHHRLRFQSDTRRYYHSTERREILPLVAAGAVVFIGRYSWKALNRMDEEWEDYLWDLKRYEHARLDAVTDATLTIGVDLGTFYLKLSRMNKNKPELIETVQGDRYRFNGILQEDNGDMTMGGRAFEKFYYNVSNSDFTKHKGNHVVLPFTELQQKTGDEATKLAQNVFVPAVGEAMERVLTNGGNDLEEERQFVRTVLTLPPVFYNKHGDELFRKIYHNGSNQTITVPEPVAAIWGAQALNLISLPKSKEEYASSSILVVDVGGLATTISLVRHDVIVACVSLDGIGGESLVQELVNHIVEQTEDETIGKDPMSLTMIQSSARSSVLELVNKAQSKVHVPFLYMGRKPEDPHLDITISRTVLEKAVQDRWNNKINAKLLEENMLSSSLPTPKDATMLFTSGITKVLEESEEIPANIESFLLVGGGSRHNMFEEAFKKSVTTLMGPANFQNKVVVPESSSRAELTALGASSLLPNFTYDYEEGLRML